MNKEKVVFIKEFKRNSLNAGWSGWPVLMDNHYVTGLDRKLWIWLVTHGYGDFLLNRELNTPVMDNKKLIVVREHFRFHPQYVLRFLRKTFPNKRIIYWFRNTLFGEYYNTGITPENIMEFASLQEELNFRIVSFDKGDCRRYGFAYIPQSVDYPGLETLAASHAECSLKWDVIWLGKDKERADFLLYLKGQFDAQDVSYKLQMRAEEVKTYAPGLKDVLIHKDVPYQQYLQDALASKAIVELCQPGQEGLTNRAIEAMLLKKKLITDYSEVDTYDFYRENNVFILGKNDISQLKTFLSLPYEPIPAEIVNQYTTEGMIRYVYGALGWNLHELD